MKSDVYFLSARTFSKRESMARIKGPIGLQKIGFEDKIRKDDKVVIKTHFGALENTRYLRPSYIRFLCDYVKRLGGHPSVAESCGWGIPGAKGEYGGRANEKEYLEVALRHGFTPNTMGAPLLMLDGSEGLNYIIQKIKGEYFEEIRVAGRLQEFNHMILASHFKGHSGAGFGGAIKNLGIGCVSKGGKTEAHTSKTFAFNFEKCEPDCNRCVEICPTGALARTQNKQLIFQEDKCRYCYMCSSVCKENGAIEIGTVSRAQFIYQMVDNAKGVIDFYNNENISYINYAIDITWKCDCCGGSDVPFVNDIGILTSKDPVALDQACVDLTHDSFMNRNSILNEIQGLIPSEKYKWFSYIPRFEEGEINLNKEGIKDHHWEIQLQAAEKIGLGNRDYNLIPIEIEQEE
ncbi:MAG: hypothetical protein BAJALOKI1v1_340023 [Promethearchaeota archaeon]|nr:MAG: hypothetical protein BAJALOKI1v1_340023 [Candidatus Lokiarchaeota archaeon]